MVIPVSGTLRNATVAEFTDSARRQLDELYHFRQLVMTAITILQRDIQGGRKFTFQESVPGLELNIDQDKFFDWLSTLDDRFMLEMTFLQLIDIFEHWLFHALRAVLGHPHRVFEKAQINVNEVLQAKALKDLKFKVVDSELDRLRRKSPKEWFDYIKVQLKVDLPDRDLRGQFREMKATRDVWVHNDGYANEFYFEKAGAFARVSPVLNARPEITDEYLHSSWEVALNLMENLGRGLSEKFDKRILSFYE